MAGRTGRRSVLRALAALTIAGTAVGVAGCSPLTTLRPYAPSDGVRAVLEDQITIENLLILTTGEGMPALVVGGVTNRTADRSVVTMTFGENGTETSVVVLGRDTVLLDPLNENGELMFLEASPVAPGAVVPVTISTEESGSVTAQVPVLDGTLEPYGEYIDALDEAVAAQ